MRRSRLTHVRGWFLLAVVGCGPESATRDHPAYAPSQIARSARGMVVSSAPLATTAGRRMLEAGGNAVDAAVATAFVLAVVEPSMSGLGGRTQMLIRTADGEFVGIDGGTEVPAGTPVAEEEITDTYGYRTIGIPGTVAALSEAVRSHGSMPWSALIAPALELAEDGFPLPAGEAGWIADAADQLRESAGARAALLDANGDAPAAGARFRQPALAGVLRALASDGPDVFYRGWIADSIAMDMERHGGFLRRADLEGYTARPSLVVRGSYRGHELIGTYLPASGATTIEALHILEQFDLSDRAGSPEWLALVAQALLLSFEDRVADLGPPAVHAETITSKTWAVERAAAIRDPALVGMTRRGTFAASAEPPHTTHLSVADGNGMLVALTQSVGPSMGARVATPGLGFLYATTMGYLAASAPGDRPFSSQSPLIVMRDGEPAFVLGGSGARRIISALVAVISQVVDGGLALEDAMVQPRLHPTEGVVVLEMHDAASWPAATTDELRRFGFVPDPRAAASYFALIHGIAWDVEMGEFVGVADPRGGGAAGGPGTGPAR